MRRTLLFLVISSLISATSAGCFIYFDDDDPDCDLGGIDLPTAADSAAPPALGLRNPYSGQCEYFGDPWPWPWPCDDRCGPCPVPTPVEDDGLTRQPAPTTGPSVGVALPSWGYCESECSGLEETTCLNVSGCRGIYSPDGLYRECWSVDQTGPEPADFCAGLDAWNCSRHDNCIAIHDWSCATPGQPDPRPGSFCGAGEFLRCDFEPESRGCYDNSECPNGYRCTAEDVCGTPPDCDPAVGCDSVCYGVCVPEFDPSDCFGEVYCDSLPPECPPNTIPGRRNGCWTGQCIPVELCEGPPPPECGFITDEATCIANIQCSPLYRGIECQCDADGCRCADWEFLSCESSWP